MQLFPEYSPAWNDKGVIFRGLGRYEEALQAYDQAIRFDLGDPEANYHHYNKGHVLMILGRYTEAIASYNQAIRLDPKFGDAYAYKGMILCELGQYQQASDCFRQALANNPSKETKQAIKQAKKQYHIR